MNDALLRAMLGAIELRHPGNHDQSVHNPHKNGATVAAMGDGSPSEILAARGGPDGMPQNKWGEPDNRPLVEQIYADRGFHVKPQLVGQEEFDQTPGELIYRGVRKSKYADDLANGPQHRVGDEGMYGSGTYVASGEYGGPNASVTGLSTARNYANVNGDGTPALSQYPAGQVMEMKLAPSARTVDIVDLTKERNALYDAAKNEHAGALSKLDADLAAGLIGTEAANARRAELGLTYKSATRFYTDDGAVAAWKGYDAIRIKNKNEDWLVVLNRSKLIINGESQFGAVAGGDK